LNAFFLDALQQYGYPALWLVVFAAAAGAPISGSFLLFAAGAFAAFGDFSLFILFPVALSAAVLGDNLGYFLGWRIGTPVLIWLERQKRFRFFSPRSLARGRAYFKRRTGWAVFITRFLIVVLGGPINFLAGTERYAYRKFLFWDISGQVLSVLISLGLGYVFATSWREVENIFGAFSGFVLAFLAAVVFAVMLTRKIRTSRLSHAEAMKSEKDEHKLPQTEPLQSTERKPTSTTLPLPLSDI
jgi:membrane-associated protein